MNFLIFHLLILCFFQSLQISASVIKEIDSIDLRTKKIVHWKGDPKKAQVFYFFSSTCPCSKSHFDHLNKLQKKYSDVVQFIGFHSSKAIPAASAHKYFKKFKLGYPLFLDRDLKYANKLRALKTPHVFFYSPGGELLFQGAATNSRTFSKADKFFLKDALSSYKNNKEIKIKNARALGCYIVR